MSNWAPGHPAADLAILCAVLVAALWQQQPDHACDDDGPDCGRYGEGKDQRLDPAKLVRLVRAAPLCSVPDTTLYHVAGKMAALAARVPDWDRPVMGHRLACTPFHSRDNGRMEA